MSEPVQEPRTRWRLKPLMTRQRLVEMVVVVFGVLIALGLENLVQEIRFQADARDLERAFVTDLEGAVAVSLERQIITPCLAQRLAVLSERLASGAGALEAVAHNRTNRNLDYATPQIYRAPTRLWITASFDRAQGSEAFKRIPAERAALYAAQFAQIADAQRVNAEEYFAIAGLAPLAYAQSDMNAEVRADLLQRVATLDRYQALMLVTSQQLVEGAFSLPEIGDDVRRPFVEERSELDEFGADIKEVYGSCVDLTVLDRLRGDAAS